MRLNFIKILFPLILMFVSFCAKKATEPQVPTQPQYSIRVGDKWEMQKWLESESNYGELYNTSLVAEKETTINNIKFYKIKDTDNNEALSPIFYINASDSILYAGNPCLVGNGFVVFRLLKSNAKQGDMWIDSTVFAGGDKVKVVSSVEAVNVSETVPAGTFNVIKTKHVAYNITSDGDTVCIVERGFSINPDVMFTYYKEKETMASGYYVLREYKLNQYIKGQ